MLNRKFIQRDIGGLYHYFGPNGSQSVHVSSTVSIQCAGVCHKVVAEMPRPRRSGLGTSRLISVISNLSAQGHALIENDRILRLQRLEKAARACGPSKTASETEFVRVLKINGQFSLELVIACVFMMWYSGTILIHLTSFNSDFVVAVRCQVPPLEKHFDFEQIVNISVKNHILRTAGVRNEYCDYDLRNYTDLVERHKYNYTAIMDEINNETTNPKQISCYKYVVKGPPPVFTDSNHRLPKYCLREEFKFFCIERKWYVLIGDVRMITLIISCTIVGFASDIYGRKPTFVVTSLLQLLSYAVILLPSKWCLLLGRIIFGCGEPSDFVIFTLFIEKCSKTTRVCMANLILILFPIAHCTAYLLCQLMYFWRHVLLANISMLLVLPFGLWYTVESPRWLMFTKRRAAAWKALQEYGADVEPNASHMAEAAPSKPTIRSVIRYFSLSVYTTRVKACAVLFTLSGIFNDISARLNKPFQHLFGWRYYLLYVMLQIIVSMVGYLLSIKAGTQKTLFLFCLTLGVVDVLLFLERIEFDDKFSFFGLVLFHKTLGHVVYCLVMYYVNELFPTPCRVTAVGVGMSLYWLGRVVEGRIIAPLTEHSPYLNHLPALVATVSCALSVSFLPNTQTEVLADKPSDTLYARIDS